MDTSSSTKKFNGIFNQSDNGKGEYQAQHYIDNKDRYKARALAWRIANREKMRANAKELKRKLRELVYEKLGHICCRCGFDDKRALQIDHVNGGGCKEYKKYGGFDRRYYKKILEDTEGNYQILCANCNWIKRSENKEHV